MNAQTVFKMFENLDKNERDQFFGMLSVWCDLRLPDEDEGKYLIVSRQEYARLIGRGRAS